MAGSTGPILAIGAITVANQSLVNSNPIDWRVPIGAGLAALAFGALESAAPSYSGIITKVAWIAVVTALFARTKAGVPSPMESFANWYNAK